MKITLATANAHKLKEMQEICQNCGIEFVLPKDGFNPIENGSTFEENSLIKAKEAYRVSKGYCLADDSGLCVNALNGAPGLFSARYAGSQDEKIKKLLDELKNKTDRTAKFVCCMTLLGNNGEILFQTTEECKGTIVKERNGTNGFGYDPIFQVENYDKTMAQLSDKEKNSISHRAKALKKVINYVNNSI